MAVYTEVGLSEAAFDLLVMQRSTIQLEALQQPVPTDHDLLLATTADQLHAKSVRQCLRLHGPLFVKRAVIDEADHQLTAVRGQELNLEQLVPERLALLQIVAQTRHQIANRLRRDGEVLDQHHLLLIALTLEHCVVDALVVMPHAKLDAHAVMQGRRAKDLGFGQRKADKTLPIGGEFIAQLRFVLSGIDVRDGHVRKCGSGLSEGAEYNPAPIWLRPGTLP